MCSSRSWASPQAAAPPAISRSRAASVTSPPLRVEPLAFARRGDEWLTRWRVVNDSATSVRCVSGIAPHSQFRGAEARFDVEIGAKSATTIELPVRMDGGPDDEIENAFLILVIATGDAQWRYLTRLRVRIDGEGTPRPIVEALTTQRVGFSGES